jgi:hypothetical protein
MPVLQYISAEKLYLMQNHGFVRNYIFKIQLLTYTIM